ncbi:MAG: histidine kinase, partial [Burkholderiales bacterium]
MDKEPEILSAFPSEAPQLAPNGDLERVLPVFDACQLGVVLRAVLFVEAVLGVAAMFDSPGAADWLGRFTLWTSGALPATLVWLVAGCGLRKPLARLPRRGQYAAGMSLGAFCGVYACAMLVMIGGGVDPPWIASALAGALFSALLIAALVLRAKGLAPAATAARLGELQERIRPHFLFNTLNSAIALVRAEPAKAEALLEDLSDLFRQALVDQGPWVTLDQEIALARRYLAIEKIRFGDRLQLEWMIDAGVGEARVPPLLLQPLVENAVRHGVEPSAAGARVRVSAERRGSRVVIKVSNTVPAGQGVRGHGVAQDNVRDRLGLLHDLEGRF